MVDMLLQEDELLRTLVDQYGAKWAQIAQKFRDKNSKQVRQQARGTVIRSSHDNAW
jgi:hypothetical protein